MKKEEFMQTLKDELTGLSKEDIDEILEDYKYHFEAGKRKGRKDSEIIKSLGSPKEIAENAKKELEDYGEKITLISSFKTLWNELVKTTKRVSRNIDKEMPKFKERVKKTFEEVEDKVKETTSNVKSQKIEKSKKQAIKSVLLFCANIFIMIWILVAFYALIISLFISGVSIMIAGIFVMIVGIFVWINPTELMLRNIALSSLFGGVGVFCLGWIWSIITAKLSRGLSWLVKKYISVTRRWKLK